MRSGHRHSQRVQFAGVRRDFGFQRNHYWNKHDGSDDAWLRVLTDLLRHWFEQCQQDHRHRFHECIGLRIYDVPARRWHLQHACGRWQRLNYHRRSIWHPDVDELNDSREYRSGHIRLPTALGWCLFLPSIRPTHQRWAEHHYDDLHESGDYCHRCGWHGNLHDHHPGLRLGEYQRERKFLSHYQLRDDYSESRDAFRHQPHECYGRSHMESEHHRKCGNSDRTRRGSV